MKEYEVEEFSLGDKQSPDKIIFRSMAELEEAYKDIDNGNDIYIIKEGIITKLLNKMINMKIYEGSIQLGARKEGSK